MIDIIIGVVFGFIFGVILWGLVRNYNVYNFLTYINSVSHNILVNYLEKFYDDEEFKPHKAEYENLKRICENINNISYSKVLLSFKRIDQLENWFTNEEIKFLNGELTK